MASSKSSPGFSVPGWVWTSTRPGTSQPPSMIRSASLTGRVLSRSPSIQNVRSSRSGSTTPRTWYTMKLAPLSFSD
jgi:hypothetical protein